MGLDTKFIEIFEGDTLIDLRLQHKKDLVGGNHTPNRSDDLLMPGQEPLKGCILS